MIDEARCSEVRTYSIGQHLLAFFPRPSEPMGLPSMQSLASAFLDSFIPSALPERYRSVDRLCGSGEGAFEAASARSGIIGTVNDFGRFRTGRV
jgi:hypothetical protein